MSDQPLDAATIERLLGEVANELGDGPEQTVIVVGGALLALHGLREATRDVDSVERVGPELRAAIARVATRHDLAPRWLNDSASSFLPATFDRRECSEIMTRRSFRVLGAPLDQVFLMKLFASRALDTDDLEALWPCCSFGSPEAAAAAFYQAYPLEERDQHLADHIRAII